MMCAIGQAPRVLGPFPLLFCVQYCSGTNSYPVRYSYCHRFLLYAFFGFRCRIVTKVRRNNTDGVQVARRVRGFGKIKQEPRRPPVYR